ncbi:DUF6261 family protein [Bacteroides sp. An322]|uniref:DUF6261 family protein n=1 Tax=Bacteroides sp. An322 TaxID=1965632 RepID=UPI000B39AF09|nr:DUF6261 family protein [Bacteroides sp. An322]OUO18465.1 hypothetical protein B5F91_10230 [Bacteroides sp. An322]
MKQIDTIRLDRLNNGAHFTFHTNTLARVKAETALAEKCAKFVTVYETDLAAEDEALKISQKSLITDDIAAADKLRDSLYRSYRKAVKGMTGFPVANIAEAAKVLAQHIKDYGIDPQMQLDKETGLLTNLCNDLTGKYAAQVATLGFTDVVTQLAEANERVNTLIEERDNEYAARTVGAMKTARTAVDEAYRQLVQVVNAFVLIEGEDAYAAFIDLQNSVILRYKQDAFTRPEEEEEDPEA